MPDNFGVIYFDELEKILNFKEELKGAKANGGEIDTVRISSAHGGLDFQKLITKISMSIIVCLREIILIVIIIRKFLLNHYAILTC